MFACFCLGVFIDDCGVWFVWGGLAVEFMLGVGYCALVCCVGIVSWRYLCCLLLDLLLNGLLGCSFNSVVVCACVFCLFRFAWCIVV